ncbi:MAG TPA: hypothetical protein PKZ53_18590, partial [Acidobacteriota bacterium]|nr:hypothetical protein [Acidobacteriota bacterium]
MKYAFRGAIFGDFFFRKVDLTAPQTEFKKSHSHGSVFPTIMQLQNLPISLFYAVTRNWRRS